MKLTKRYDDGSFGVANDLPCGENSHEFKELLVEKVGILEHEIEDAITSALRDCAENGINLNSQKNLDINLPYVLGFVLGYLGEE